MELKLERPLVMFDIESTGVTPGRDRIVELAVLKIMPDGTRQSVVRRLNPEMPIPPSATAIHGICDADVANSPTFAVIAANLARYLENCDLGGYNVVNFDIPMLQNEFQRAGVPFSMENRKVVDAYTLFCKLYPRTLTAAYNFFCGKELADAHSADADTAATWEVLLGQLARHPELPRELGALAELCNNADPDAIDRTRRFKFRDGEAVVNFGKNAGRPLKEIAEQDPGFLRWIMRSDFPDDVKKIASDALSGIFPKLESQS
ncbi:MAG: exonuclease domain-containing protein [Victivallaceae bacterium]